VTHKHKHTLSEELLWTRDQPVAQTATRQHATFTRDRHPCSRGNRTRNSSKPGAAELLLKL